MKASYTLRLPEDLKRKIKQEAARSDVSVNQYILFTLTKEISYKEAAIVLKDRIKNAPSREGALDLLESVVPDVPPLEKDPFILEDERVD
jgi:hypothetical protein